MDAHVKTVREILHAGDQFLVPFFQRNYSWQKIHWRRLLDDILALIEEPSDIKHFLGPLVCTPFRPTPGEVTPYQLIDGQQRLTTISLLLAALRDVVRVRGFEDLGDEIEEDFLVHRRRNGLQRYKVVPRSGDRDIYQALVDGRPVENGCGIREAFEFFKRECKTILANADDAAARRFLVTATARLSLVTITISTENPYEIFESLNSKGLPLEEADLIRNYVFMQVPLEDQDGFSATRWQPFERRFESGRNQEEVSSTEFYRSYLMREGAYCRKGAAYVAFRKEHDERKLTPFAQVDELDRYATFELLLRRPEDAPEEFRWQVREIQSLDITTAHPLLLNLLNRWKDETLSSADLKNCLSDLASFVIRRSICGESTRGYGRLFTKAIGALGAHPHEHLREFWLQSGWPDDAVFVPRLVEFPIYQREYKKCVLFLQALEKQTGHKEPIELNALTIEHVLPQTVGENETGETWQRMLGPNWQESHKRWVHALGNLTLTGYNSELGNDTFHEKKAALAQSNVAMNRYFSDIQSWDTDQIRKRGTSLAQRVAHRWIRPAGRPYTPPTESSTSQDAQDDRAPDPRAEGRLCIRIRWSRLNKSGADSEITGGRDTETIAKFFGELIRTFGEPMAEKLSTVPVIRNRYSLSRTPSVDFLNPQQGAPFNHKRIPGTDLYVFTNTDTNEKVRDVQSLPQKLGFPVGSIEAFRKPALNFDIGVLFQT